MEARNVAFVMLIVVGVACLAYGLYRFMALGESLLPLVPVGILCAGMGFVLKKTQG